MGLVSLLATVADLKASQKAGAISPVMPAGVILPYGGTSAPAGWLECNGQAVSETDYPELYAAISSNYNGQLNPTTGSNWAAPSAGQFRVPDMRGMFMRGEGTPSGLDAVTVGSHQADKTKKNGLNASGTNVTTSVSGNKDQMNITSATMSANASLSHSYSLGANLVANAFGSGGNSVAQYAGSGGLGAATVNSHSLNHTHGINYSGTFSASGTTDAGTITVGNGDNETRPMNRGVKYIIKT